MTECTQSSFEFASHLQRQVVARFDGGTITSDAGALLLRQVEQRTGILRQFAGCFRDHRRPERIEHSVAELVRQRRVIAKAEHLEKRANPRFVVTSLSAGQMEAREWCENFYCARGEMENRLKEQQLGLFADRTSTAWLRSNQLRLYFSSIAYCLLEALRRLGLRGTEMARARCRTVRVKRLKIGAQIRVTARKVWVSMAGGCPYAEVYGQVFRHLEAVPRGG